MSDKANFINALTMLLFFKHVYGLCINLNRSGVAGINIDYHVLQDLGDVEGCGMLDLSMTYLGMALC